MFLQNVTYNGVEKRSEMYAYIGLFQDSTHMPRERVLFENDRTPQIPYSS